MSRTRTRSFVIGGYDSPPCGDWAGPETSIECGATGVPGVSNTISDEGELAATASILTRW